MGTVMSEPEGAVCDAHKGSLQERKGLSKELVWNLIDSHGAVGFVSENPLSYFVFSDFWEIGRACTSLSEADGVVTRG